MSEKETFDGSGLEFLTPEVLEEMKEAGIVFNFFPPNVHTCEQVVVRLAQGSFPTGLELGQIISHFKDKAVEHTEACQALSAEHLEDMLEAELALLNRNLAVEGEE